MQNYFETRKLNFRTDSATFSAPKSPVSAISDSIKRKMSAPKVHTSVSVSSLSRFVHVALYCCWTSATTTPASVYYDMSARRRVICFVTFNLMLLRLYYAIMVFVSLGLSPNMINFRTEEVASASSELGEYKRVQEYCSNRLDSLLDDLQNTICDLCEEQTDHEDKLMVSLAGLKQVCFVASTSGIHVCIKHEPKVGAVTL